MHICSIISVFFSLKKFFRTENEYAHEIKTKLNKIAGSIEVLQKASVFYLVEQSIKIFSNPCENLLKKSVWKFEQLKLGFCFTQLKPFFKNGIKNVNFLKKARVQRVQRIFSVLFKTPAFYVSRHVVVAHLPLGNPIQWKKYKI